LIGPGAGRHSLARSVRSTVDLTLRVRKERLAVAGTNAASWDGQRHIPHAEREVYCGRKLIRTFCPNRGGAWPSAGSSDTMHSSTRSSFTGKMSRALPFDWRLCRN